MDVDCTARFEAVGPDNGNFASHTFYFDDPRFYEDLAITLLGRADRSVLPTRDRYADTNPPAYRLKPA